MHRTLTLLCIFILSCLLIMQCRQLDSKQVPEREEIVSSLENSDNHHDETDTVSLSPEAMKKINVETVEVKYRHMKNSITVPGQVLADQNREAFVGSLISGKIYDVAVNQGDFVNKGDILLRIESLEFGEIKGQYIHSKAELDFSKATYERLDTLYKQNVGSFRSILEAKADLDKAKALFVEADIKLHSIGINGKEENKGTLFTGVGVDAALLSIKAPISGTIIERNVVIGQNVNPSYNLMHIIDLSAVWVDAQVYEKDLAAVYSGKQIVFNASALPGISFRGKILFFNKVLDPETRTVKVRAEIKNPEELLLPEMYGDVKIVTKAESQVLSVPSEVVQTADNRSFVFIPGDERGEFVKKEVTIGRTVEGWTEIIDGLKEKDSVVLKGAFDLYAESQKGKFEAGHAH